MYYLPAGANEWGALRCCVIGYPSCPFCDMVYTAFFMYKSFIKNSAGRCNNIQHRHHTSLSASPTSCMYAECILSYLHKPRNSNVSDVLTIPKTQMFGIVALCSMYKNTSYFCIKAAFFDISFTLFIKSVYLYCHFCRSVYCLISLSAVSLSASFGLISVLTFSCLSAQLHQFFRQKIVIVFSYFPRLAPSVKQSDSISMYIFLISGKYISSVLYTVLGVICRYLAKFAFVGYMLYSFSLTCSIKSLNVSIKSSGVLKALGFPDSVP